MKTKQLFDEDAIRIAKEYGKDLEALNTLMAKLAGYIYLTTNAEKCETSCDATFPHTKLRVTFKYEQVKD